MFELTGFQRDILYCIAALEEPYGLGIKPTAEQKSITGAFTRIWIPSLTKATWPNVASTNEPTAMN